MHVAVVRITHHNCGYGDKKAHTGYINTYTHTHSLGRYSANGTCGTIISGSSNIFIQGSGAQSTVLDCMNAGRHFKVEDNSKIRLANIKLINGKDEQGGSILALGHSQVVWENTVISNSEAAAGGAIYAADGTRVTLIGRSVIQDARADEGGCVYMKDNCETSLSGYAELRNCLATQNSGGIHAASSSIEFVDFAKATRCRATESGGVASFPYGNGSLFISGQASFSFNAAGPLSVCEGAFA
jgi:hypothetical protein